MERVYNFSAGPSMLPLEVLEKAAAEMLCYKDSGMSVMEMSHRSPVYEEIIQDAEKLLRKIMNIPDNYKVLFLQGGASTQFAAVPLNLMNKNNKADYIVSGQFSGKAYKEAQKYGDAACVATSKDANFAFIPETTRESFRPDADYVHICFNNTIYGTEIHEDIDCPVPLIADMSSDILSRPVDVSKYAMIYGGAQKNVGPAGVTFFIVKKDLLGKVSRYIPTMLNLQTHIDGGSMFNTPPVFPIFVMTETLKWVKELGGVEAIYKINKEKAAILYDEIDRNSLFTGTAAKEDRSIMNVCFVMAPGYEDLQDEFMNFAKERGMVGIKGHRSVGGFRASIYNACPVESVKALVECMKEFEALKK